MRNKLYKTKHSVRFLTLAAFFLLTNAFVSVGQAALPYENSFETNADTIGWKFLISQVGVQPPRSKTTKWLVGNAEPRLGQKSLYVSRDNGATAGYDNATGGAYGVIAYKDFTLQAGTYDFSFDWKALGTLATGGSVGDALGVAVVPQSTAVEMLYSGTFPAYITNADNKFTASAGQSIYYNSPSWKNELGTLNILATGTYKLVFVWKVSTSTESKPGACIDNIQIGKRDAGACYNKPTGFTQTTTSTHIDFTWTGTASSYSLLYYSAIDPSTYTVIPNIPANNYSLDRSSLPEGVYSFKVRSVCGNDSSIWVQSEETSNILVYDPAKHCLDYLNFTAPGVTPTYSKEFGNPYATAGVMDAGYEPRKKTHTIHYIPDEYDAETGGLLRTVPTGELASVRLGNWSTGELPMNAASDVTTQSITYELRVTEDIGVLLLKYAVVLQNGGHGPDNQPKFLLQILDSAGVMIDPKCAAADFSAPQSTANVDGWNTNGLIRWRDWTTIGINLNTPQYQGKLIKIRLISRACYANYHYGYGYFTLNCTDGKIRGVTSCGEKPDSFIVDQGFEYRWKNKYTGQHIGTDAGNPTKSYVDPDEPYIFRVAPQDTATYIVDMMYSVDTTCHFTLEASTMARLPKAKAEFKHTPANCVNKVTITNNSGVFGIMPWENDKEVPTGEDVETWEWDFGPYGTSTLKNPTNLDIVPNTGDTIDVTLKVTMADGGCVDIQTFRVEIPAIGPTYETTEIYICESQLPYTYNGKTYTQADTYIDDLESWAGCDSTLTLNLKVLETENITQNEEICSDGYYVFFGDTLRTTNSYEYTLPSKVLSCDSIVFALNLTVREALYLDIDSSVVYTECADGTELLIDYVVTSGQTSTFEVIYSESGYDAGFRNRTGYVTKPIRIPFENVRAGKFTATLRFFDQCGDTVFPINILIQYPDSIITQRWNDVLSVRNSIYNGGYEFSSYQWYKDGVEIPGATKSYLYVPEGLDFNAAYAVNLIQQGQIESIMSCEFIPEYIPGQITVYPTAVRRGMNLTAEVPTGGTISVYDIMGLKYGETNLYEGRNQLTAPDLIGIYLYQIRLSSGEERIYRVSVSE